MKTAISEISFHCGRWCNHRQSSPDHNPRNSQGAFMQKFAIAIDAPVGSLGWSGSRSAVACDRCHKRRSDLAVARSRRDQQDGKFAPSEKDISAEGEDAKPPRQSNRSAPEHRRKFSGHAADPAFAERCHNDANETDGIWQTAEQIGR